jgi:lactate dehydrogenase-like 2-hydroxyacid dehydrogenase
MIVARQFTAWDLRGNEIRTVGYGVIGLAIAHRRAGWQHWASRSNRSLRDGAFSDEAS